VGCVFDERQWPAEESNSGKNIGSEWSKKDLHKNVNELE